MIIKQTASFSLMQTVDGIAILTMDVPGESTNTLRAEFTREFREILNALKANPALQGLLIRSGKADSFIVGADINMLKTITKPEDAMQLTEQGHALMRELQALNIPLVAAIHGPALGGGLELALCCHERVLSDDAKTIVGLPEVQLGVLPGGGGTQRLPKLIGMAAALDMMLTGKQVRAKQALKMGLCDEVVPLANLEMAALKRIKNLQGKPHRQSFFTGLRKPAVWYSVPGLLQNLLESHGPGRRFMASKARAEVLRKTYGNYPAPGKIIDCVLASYGAEGFAFESRSFGELVVTPVARQLMNVFFAVTALKKDAYTTASAAAVANVAVLGGGLMGAGIASITVDKAKIAVRVKDRDDKGTAHARQYVHDLIFDRVKKRHLTMAEAGKIESRLSTTTDYSGFKRVDLVIEAVFEDLQLKQTMVDEVEAVTPPHCIFASNTSSIPIHRIAEKARRPEQIIGLHYFSPVDKMPLLEIITTDKTADWVVNTCVEFGRAQGKTVIVVRDHAGFYVNRILAPYMNEAGQLLAGGVAIDTIDQALLQFGFPIGPINLLDEVGIDVGTKVAPILAEAFGERMLPPPVFQKLIEDKRLGKKNGRGFYRYDQSSKGPRQVDESVYAVLGIGATHTMAQAEIAERCVLLMVNEAIRCLDEGIIRCARDGDIGAIFGIGFPPFTGGPFRYADAMGCQQVLQKLEAMQHALGPRFEPAPGLRSRAASGSGFY